MKVRLDAPQRHAIAHPYAHARGAPPTPTLRVEECGLLATILTVNK